MEGAMKKAGKLFLYAAPVMLAGGLYLGESTGMNEVLAKTVTTMVQTKTVGDKCGYTVLNEDKGSTYDEDSYHYVFTSKTSIPFDSAYYYYDRYNMITTEIETETEVPDTPESEDTGDKVVPTTAPTEETTATAPTEDTKTESTEDKSVPITAPTEETTATAPTEDAKTESAGEKVTPAVDPKEEEAKVRAGLEEAERNREKAREEAAWKVQKEAEKQAEDFEKLIRKSIQQARRTAAEKTGAVAEAAGNATAAAEAAEAPAAVIKTDYFTCFTKRAMKLLADNADIRYEIHYRYKGKQYVLIIPAGTDYSQLQDSNGYYGFRYLDGIFGGYEESTK